jgi:hypothetical protein
MSNVTTALKPEEVSRVLRLNEVAKNHVWKVQPSCAKNGDGIFEGLVGFLPMTCVFVLTYTAMARSQCTTPTKIDDSPLTSHHYLIPSYLIFVYP